MINRGELMNDQDNKIEGLLEQVYGFDPDPAVIQSLREIPEAKEYLIKNMNLKLKDGESTMKSAARASKMATALGEIGAPKDVVHLNVLFQDALILKLGCIDLLKAEGIELETFKHLDSPAYTYNTAKMHDVIFDTTAQYILEAMVKLNGGEQALKSMEILSELKLNDSKKEYLKKMCEQLENEAKNKTADYKLLLSKMKKRLDPGFKKGKDTVLLKGN